MSGLHQLFGTSIRPLTPYSGALASNNTDDTSHSGPSDGPFIYFSHTSDFETFTAPVRWNSNESATVIDQEIQHIGGRPYVRYLSDTDVVKRVVLDRSDDGLFGTWKRVVVPVDKLRE